MTKVKKPIRLFVIGWAWIIFAVISLTDSVYDFIKIEGKIEILQNLIKNPPPELHNVVELLSNVVPYFLVFMVIKAFLSISGFFLAINLLCLKKWARKYLELITWLSVIEIFIAIIFAFKFNMATALDGREWHKFEFSIFVLLAFTLPFILISWQLRSKRIKELFV